MIGHNTFYLTDLAVGEGRSAMERIEALGARRVKQEVVDESLHGWWWDVLVVLAVVLAEGCGMLGCNLYFRGIIQRGDDITWFDTLIADALKVAVSHVFGTGVATWTLLAWGRYHHLYRGNGVYSTCNHASALPAFFIVVGVVYLTPILGHLLLLVYLAVRGVEYAARVYTGKSRTVRLAIAFFNLVACFGVVWLVFGSYVVFSSSGDCGPLRHHGVAFLVVIYSLLCVMCLFASCKRALIYAHSGRHSSPTVR
eukprot:Sspe_Gene.97202::Locus_70825_Transcript_1_2_Confidence_0.667_Length_1038::g.97202::m.97202